MAKLRHLGIESSKTAIVHGIKNKVFVRMLLVLVGCNDINYSAKKCGSSESSIKERRMTTFQNAIITITYKRD